MNLLENELYIQNLEEGIKGINEILKKFKGKSILITGSTGLIGSSVVDLLMVANEQLDLNLTIYALGRNLKKIRNRFFATKVKKCVVAILYDATKTFQFNHKADYIIHAASNATPSLYTDQPVETMQGNILGLMSLLEFSKRQNVDKILYVSSSEVYGEFNTDKPLLESNYGYIDILDPRSSYSMGKRVSETLCISYLKEYQVNSVIVRPGHIYGPSAKKEDSRVSSAFVYDALQGKKIVMKSKGRQIRSYTYSIDCATAILVALANGKSGEAYNISNPNSIVSIAEMAKVIADLGKVGLSFDLPTKSDSRKFNPMINSSLNSEKIYSLGWKALFDVKQGFRYTLAILSDSR